ncbi:MAG: hypothetical protein DYG89_00525 [Caldilinea sp. CFX5]|nr:hypothetical protein [Caldilinea sp. CFX5]
MKVVRILKNWSWPNPLRQTQEEKGIWEDIQFTLDPVRNCDYTLVLNYPSEDTTVQCPSQHIWAIIQEPPNEKFTWMHRGDISFSRVYTSDPGLNGLRYIHSQPAVAWHVNRSYDFLMKCGPPQKEYRLSWITSNISAFQGHRKRLAFLQQLQGRLTFDLYGRGFHYIEDKWDGLAPYRYSIVVENFSNPYYWSEKLADCFLTWTMPIYYGCTRITEFFPKEALVQIDIADPLAAEKINEIIDSNMWEERFDAIAHARQLVLNRYQLFPFVTQEIKKHENGNCTSRHYPQTITIPKQTRPPLTVGEKTLCKIRQYTPSYVKKFINRFRYARSKRSRTGF